MSIFVFFNIFDAYLIQGKAEISGRDRRGFLLEKSSFVPVLVQLYSSWDAIPSISKLGRFKVVLILHGRNVYYVLLQHLQLMRIRALSSNGRQLRNISLPPTDRATRGSGSNFSSGAKNPTSLFFQKIISNMYFVGIYYCTLKYIRDKTCKKASSFPSRLVFERHCLIRIIALHMSSSALSSCQNFNHPRLSVLQQAFLFRLPRQILSFPYPTPPVR